ncbi:MAG: iron-siderophore ABC transporter substrate-binding protein [Actinopolymorphaceae bacterium]
MGSPAPAHPLGLSRRTFGVSVSAALLAALAGCRGTDTGSSTTSAEEPAAADAASSAFPATVEHRYGRTTIPAAPKRVAVVGLMEQDALLALGVVPVAATEWFGEYPGAIWPWAKDALGDSPVPERLSSVDGIEFEKVAAVQPDLIIGIYSGQTREHYETLSKIAPTIAQPKGSTIDWAVSWQEITTMVGAAVGKPDKAKALVDDLEALVAEYAADNPSFKGRTALMATPYEGIYVYGADDPRSQLLRSLGFVMPEGLGKVTGKEFGANLSEERTDLLDVDALVWLFEKYEADKRRIDANPLYTRLGVRTEGRDIFVAGDKEKAYYGATSFISVLSLPMLLAGLVPQLAAAVDGEPTTAVPLVTAPPKAPSGG